MTGHVLLGPFLTRAGAARRAGLSPDDVALRPGLLRITGPWLDEAYYGFQFGARGIRRDVARVVQSLKSRYADEAIAHWLASPNPSLHGYAPLDRIGHGSAGYERVREAADALLAQGDPGRRRQPGAGDLHAPGHGSSSPALTRSRRAEGLAAGTPVPQP